MKKSSVQNAKRNEKIFAYVLLIPFAIGFILFFLQPLILSAIYSLNDVSFTGGKTQFKWIGAFNYHRSLLVLTDFRDLLIGGLEDLIINVPVILFFSLFIATIFNKKFAGLNAFRVIMFLPVIMTTGVLLSVEASDYLIGASMDTSSMAAGGSAAGFATEFNLENLLMSLQLPTFITSYLGDIMSRLYQIITSSGVQITVLLAALQSISPSLYEASSIEGATPWDDFWKITIPMVSPYLFVCALYTVIDTFINPTNELVKYIRDVAYGQQLNYGLSSAMAWLYFALIALVLGLVAYLFLGTKFVKYQD